MAVWVQLIPIVQMLIILKETLGQHLRATIDYSISKDEFGLFTRVRAWHDFALEGSGVNQGNGAGIAKIIHCLMTGLLTLASSQGLLFWMHMFTTPLM